MMHYADMFQMRRFNLLVVDECHYATGNHAYAVIMNKFYHVLPKEERPRVIGLTASPLCNVRKLFRRIFNKQSRQPDMTGPTYRRDSFGRTARRNVE
jgi:superfamily II DNA or RNA helicase